MQVDLWKNVCIAMRLQVEKTLYRGSPDVRQVAAACCQTTLACDHLKGDNPNAFHFSSLLGCYASFPGLPTGIGSTPGSVNKIQIDVV